MTTWHGAERLGHTEGSVASRVLVARLVRGERRHGRSLGLPDRVVLAQHLLALLQVGQDLLGVGEVAL